MPQPDDQKDDGDLLSSKFNEDYEEEFKKVLDSDEDELESEAEDEEEPDNEDSEESDDEESDDQPDNDEDDPDEEEEESPADKRYRELQSYKDRVINSKDAEIKALKEQLAAKGSAGGDEGKEEQADDGDEVDVEKFIQSIPEKDRQIFEDNPEIVKYLAKNRGGVSKAEVSKLIKEALDEQKQAFESQKQTEVEVQETQRELQSLEKKFPGAMKMIDDPVFQAWRTQNSAIVDAISAKESDRVGGAVAVLKFYQTQMQQFFDPDLKKALLKSTSKSPKGRSTTRASRASEDDYEGSFDEFAKTLKD